MIDYEEEWLTPLLFKKAGSVFFKASHFAIPSCALTLLLHFLKGVYPAFFEQSHLKELSSSQLWNPFAAALIFMIGFRSNRAIARFWEGTGLMHQMRGEWFDTVSNCITFSSFSTKSRDEVMEFRHVLVRLMSLCHGNAIEEISGNQFELPTIDVRGIDAKTMSYLKNGHEDYAFNKVEMAIHMIQMVITNALETGVLKVPPPILSRVYQTISRGFVNLLNTKKITDTKFPFPYAQLIALALVAFSLVLPFLFSASVQSRYLAAVATFTPVFILAGLNYIAIELENPFGHDDNDLPLKEFQMEMDNCLLMLLHPQADTVPTISPNIQMSFDILVDTFKEQECDIPEKGFQRFAMSVLHDSPPQSSNHHFESLKRLVSGSSNNDSNRSNAEKSHVPLDHSKASGDNSISTIAPILDSRDATFKCDGLTPIPDIIPTECEKIIVTLNSSKFCGISLGSSLSKSCEKQPHGIGIKPSIIDAIPEQIPFREKSTRSTTDVDGESDAVDSFDP